MFLFLFHSPRLPPRPPRRPPSPLLSSVGCSAYSRVLFHPSSSSHSLSSVRCSAYSRVLSASYISSRTVRRGFPAALCIFAANIPYFPAHFYRFALFVHPSHQKISQISHKIVHFYQQIIQIHQFLLPLPRHLHHFTPSAL